MHANQETHQDDQTEVLFLSKVSVFSPELKNRIDHLDGVPGMMRELNEAEEEAENLAMATIQGESLCLSYGRVGSTQPTDIYLSREQVKAMLDLIF